MGVTTPHHIRNALIGGQVVLCVGLGLPVVYSIEFNENTGITPFVAEVLAFGAVVVDFLNIKIAELLVGGALVVVALVDVGAPIGAVLIGLFVGLQKLIQIIAPMLPIVFIVSLFEPNQSTLHVLLAGSWSESQSWVGTDATVAQLPLRHALIDGLVED